MPLANSLAAQSSSPSGSGIGTTGWIIFGVVVAVMLIVDLLVHRSEKAKTRNSAGIWTGIWIGLGLTFTGVVWWLLDGQAAREYIAVYALEKSLSMDNLFVFFVIFHGLNIPQRYHHKVLYWGILGALVFRFIFIFAGVAAINQFDWIVYVFGVLLLWAAWRSYKEDPTEETESGIVSWLDGFSWLTEESHGGKFFTHENGKRVGTALFMALVAIELSDIMFAIDSVAAALSVTNSEFEIYSANIFAILGLRSLYLLLEDIIDEFVYLHYGLAAVLAFAGLKLLTKEAFHIPPLLSVGIIIVIIGASIWASLRSDKSTGRIGQKEKA